MPMAQNSKVKQPILRIFGSNVKSVQLKWKTGNEGAKKYVNPSDVNNYSEIKAKKLEAKFAKDTQTVFV